MTLASILDRQLNLLNELLLALREEQDCLVAREDSQEVMTPVVSRKARAIEELNALEADRRSLLAQLDYPDETAASEAAARDHDCLGQWQQVQDLSRQAAHHNTVNGSLIQMRMSHNSRVLAQLRHLAGTRLYGADGQTQKTSGRLETSA